MFKFIVNNRPIETSLPPGTVLLDFLRDELKLTGTKEGCREGECGACTVLIGELLENGKMNYKACASCLVPLGEVQNKHIVTIEGLNSKELTVVQQGIFDNNASQCGFCTPGIILSLTGFLLSSPAFSYSDAINALDGNLCRCTGYASIKKAGKALSDIFSKKEQSCSSRIEQLIQWSVLPAYFLNIPEKLSLLPKSAIHNPKSAILIAGATDLLIQEPDKLLESELNFISRHPELSKIELGNDTINVGGGVTVEEFRNSDIVNKFFPTMKDDLLLVSSTIIRNKATLAGNIVNASPIADMSIILLALNAVLLLKNDKNRRSVALKDFYKDYKIFDLKRNEILEKIQIPLPGKDFFFSFEKVSNRKYLDIASCNSAMYLEAKDKKIEAVRLSAGGVAPVPLLLKQTSAFLEGKKISSEIISEAQNILAKEISPIDDIRGTAQYKKLLLEQLLFAHFNNLL